MHNIHVQRVEICQNQYFVFGCTSLSVLTFFSTVNSTGRWWRRTMNSNPTTSYLWGYSHAKSQINWIKTVAVTVRPLFLINMAAMTSLIMLMSKNGNSHNQNPKTFVCGKFNLIAFISFHSGLVLKTCHFKQMP